MLMAFREYVTCGFEVIFFLHRESAVLGGMKGLKGKNNILGASSLEFALSTKCAHGKIWTCAHVEMWICGHG